MSGRREHLAVLERRKNVARRYVRGEMQWEIAEAFEVDPGTISRDLAAIRAAWLAEAVADIDAHKARELAKLDEVEREAWAGWKRSQETAETRRERNSDRGSVSERVSKGQAGNPKFLAVVRDCVKQRCEILGILEVAGAGQTTVVTVVGGIDLQAIAGDKPGLPYDGSLPEQ